MDLSLTKNSYSPIKTLKSVGRALHKIEHIPSRHREMLETRYKHIVVQLITLFVILPLAYAGTLIVNWWWPDFFVYTYLQWQLPSLETLKGFWPLGLWCLFLTSITGNSVRSSELDGALWRSGMISGNLAGLWEETGFRYLFICFAMVSIVFYNWLLGMFAWVLVGVMAIFTIATIVDDDHPKIASAAYAVITILTAIMLTPEDPLIWIYANVFIPVISWVSFGTYDVIFNNPTTYPPLMVMGAILANAWFRDGHKYQGWLGYLDSWVIGFVFVYAMFVHGLITAIVLHGLWNTTVYTSLWCKRKLFG